MTHFRSLNSPQVFCLGVAAAVFSIALLGHVLNHAWEWSGGTQLLPVEGSLISEMALDGLAGLACFYLTCGLVALFRRA